MVRNRGFMCMECGNEWHDENIRLEEGAGTTCPDCGSAEVYRSNFGSYVPGDVYKGPERRRRN